MGLRHKEKNTQKNLKQTEDTSAVNSYESQKYYIDDNVELDALERLKSNIMMLDDLQKRLGFMNSELESVIGSRKK